jgi:hypothetical protein
VCTAFVLNYATCLLAFALRLLCGSFAFALR